MKPTNAALLLFFGSSFFSVAYGHGEEKHSEPREYDAVKTEFGSYEPTLVPDRTIEIGMSDNMRFTPNDIQVTAGEKIKFVVTNNGALKHEFVLGTPESLKDHAAMMIKFPNMEHEEPYMAHVSPGKSMDIVWQFSESGIFEFGCLLPGHFDAGMKGILAVK